MSPRTPPRAGGALPVIGHIPPLLRDPLGFLCGLRDNGDVLTIRLGPKHLYAVCTPELVGELLIHRGHCLDVGGRLWDTLRVLLGDGVATSNGVKHQRQRRLIQPAFTPRRLTAYAEVMETETHAMADSWRPGQVIDVDAAVFRAITRIMCRSLIQADSVVAQADDLAAALQEIFGELFRRMIVPIDIAHRLQVRRDRRFRQALRTWRTAIDTAIEERRTSGERRDDLLGSLLHPADGGAPLPYADVRDTIVAFFVAGTGNVSGTVASTLHLLCEHPDTAAHLRAEVNRVTAGRPVRVDDLPRLPLTRNVVTESIRIRPTHWIMTRRATRAFTLGGYTFPEGADIVFSPYAIQHDPRIFPAPDVFDPDRWLPENARAAPKYAMAPHGIGSRKCPGELYSLTEAALFTATIMGRWELQPVAETDPSLRMGITLHPAKPLLRTASQHPRSAPTTPPRMRRESARRGERPCPS
ncbi:cytochrome P450 [Nocardia thraciensis]